ncbi:hypothetical protein M8542_36620 [Amycolatopsis sp. OK19-0408]|uniref:Uncharacterized protein n=1 Tax=Amycolatopsis iheyensis TaxID=2945988 RepID=A0A9X2NGQ2_9PSEU|nr:hypothetical protein [Amycolatopsis iheyensis]MCR6488369.1 hypothetical protein [Amycolatopsis iheyensis]
MHEVNIEEAEDAAGRLPGITAETGSAQISAATVAICCIGVRTALGVSATTLAYFGYVDPGRPPTPERRALA